MKYKRIFPIKFQFSDKNKLITFIHAKHNNVSPAL